MRGSELEEAMAMVVDRRERRWPQQGHRDGSRHDRPFQHKRREEVLGGLLGQSDNARHLGGKVVVRIPVSSDTEHPCVGARGLGRLSGLDRI